MGDRSVTVGAERREGPMKRVLAALALLVPLSVDAGPLVVYGDALENGFADWSWATHSLSQTAVVRSGARAVSFEPDGWAGLYLQRDAGIDLSAYDALDLWVHGGTTGGQSVRIGLLVANQLAADAPLERFVAGGSLPAGKWVNVRVPFASLGVTSGVLSGFWLQDGSGGNQAAVYVDDVQLAERSGPSPPSAPLTVSVDPAADRRPVSPLVYGVSFGSASQLSRLKFPVRRWGGNSTTRYNWQADTSNRASDWFFYNVPEDNANPGSLPHGSAVDVFVDEARAAGSEPLVTVPLIGWTPVDRSRRWGFSVKKYGAQQQTECTATGGASWCNADAGNGNRPDGTPLAGNDPRDTSKEIGPDFVTEWMKHLASRTGTAGRGGVKLFALDNEPNLWPYTHRDVHPQMTTYDELWQRTRDYASAIKAQDPDARVLGPVAWGWCEYFTSAADGCPDGPDRRAHGGLPLLAWYLSQVEAHRVRTGVRLVDYLDVHYYPQAANVALSDDETAGTSALRLRSLKSLYDPSYVDESWIGTPVTLIPLLKGWIDAHAPGTKLAITEYSWGGDQGLSSTLAQAEALAIFGREGVDLANRWVAPADDSRMEDAFRLYLDYDGAGARVGGESVRAVSSDVDVLGAYALRDAAKVYVLLFNKDTAARAATVQVAGAAAGRAALYRFDASTRLAPAGSAEVSGGALALALPGRSATLAVLGAGGGACPPSSAEIVAPDSVCAGSTGQAASVAAAPAGATYAWTISGGTITSGAGTRSVTFAAGTGAAVVLGVTVASGGCSATGSKTVAVAKPAAPVVTLSASVPDAGPGASYSWSITGGSLTGGNGTPSVTFLPTRSLAVSLAVIVRSPAGCTTTSSIRVPAR
jgi:hypothetical protein